MKRRAAYSLLLIILACAAPFAPGQNAAKGAPEPKEKPAYVYRTFTDLTARSAEYEREH